MKISKLTTYDEFQIKLINFSYVLIKRMDPQCAQPQCVYNCCNQQGKCPTSIKECITKRNLDPVWTYIIICAIFLCVIVGVVLVLEYVTRRKRRMQLKKDLLSNQISVPNEGQKQIEIQLSSKKQTIDIQKLKKRQALVVNQVFPYEKTKELDSVLKNRKSDAFSTSRDSRLRESVEVYFSKRFSRILDDNQ